MIKGLLALAGQSAYVVTFGRAGEDNKKFKLGDVEQTLAGFAGADYDLQARLWPPHACVSRKPASSVHAAQGGTWDCRHS